MTTTTNQTLALLSLTTIFTACSTSDAASTRASAAPTQEERVARGKYIVSAGGCHDCHTPVAMGAKGPEPMAGRALSGHPEMVVMPPPPELPPGPWIVSFGATATAYAGPWGVSYSANLTPDKETGLGTWTEQNFVDTIRNGRHQGVGRPLMPPMPWEVFSNYTDEDLKAIFAYLQSIPAVKNHVPQNTPPKA